VVQQGPADPFPLELGYYVQRVQVPEVWTGSRDTETHRLPVGFGEPEAVCVPRHNMLAEGESTCSPRNGVLDLLAM
jgi:hypothetical protein